MAIQISTTPEGIIEPQRKTKITGEFDVVIIGGGTAGAAAAVAASRNGSKTVIVERFGCLGGTFSGGLMNHGDARHAIYDKVPHEKETVRGIYQEIIDRCRSLGGYIEEYEMKQKILPFIGGVDVFSPEVLKYVLFQMSTENNVTIFLHTIATEVVLREKRVIGVIVENKSGRSAIMGNTFVDATGDADIAALSGAAFEKGREPDGKMQPATLTFRIGNVDIQAFMKAYATDQRKISIQPGEKDFEKIHPFTIEIAKARKSGELTVPRDDITFHLTPIEGILYVNGTRIHGIDGTDASSMSRGEIQGREQVFQLVSFFRNHIIGCNRAVLIDTGNSLGLRETRRIIGEYVLTGEDVLLGKAFEDTIGQSSQRIDEHSPDGSSTNLKKLKSGSVFHVPFRCLVPKEIDALIIAGRCISTSRDAQGAIRMVPMCVTTGQAAGTAAALCVQDDTLPRAINISALQEKLRSQGAIL